MHSEAVFPNRLISTSSRNYNVVCLYARWSFVSLRDEFLQTFWSITIRVHLLNDKAILQRNNLIRPSLKLEAGYNFAITMVMPKTSRSILTELCLFLYIYFWTWQSTQGQQTYSTKCQSNELYKCQKFVSQIVKFWRALSSVTFFTGMTKPCLSKQKLLQEFYTSTF
jgi:hypothetical protein